MLPPQHQRQAACPLPDSPPPPLSRYLSRSDFQEVHRKSAAFLRFKEAQSQLPFPVEVTGQSYLETNFGFM